MTHEDEERCLDVLLLVVKLLEDGNWREALVALRHTVATGGALQLVKVEACLRSVARCQRLQCATGDVQQARAEAEKAAEILSGYPRTRPRLGADPAPAQRLTWLIWVTTRLVLRDLAELDALRAIFVDLRRGRDELV